MFINVEQILHGRIELDALDQRNFTAKVPDLLTLKKPRLLDVVIV